MTAFLRRVGRAPANALRYLADLIHDLTRRDAP